MYSDKKWVFWRKKKKHCIFFRWFTCFSSFYFALISFVFSKVCSYKSNDFCISAFNMLESIALMFARLRLSENNVVKPICSPVKKSFIDLVYIVWFITSIIFLCTEVSIYGSLICCFSMSASQYQYERSFSCILYYTNSNMIISSMYTCFWCMDLTLIFCTVQINTVVRCILLDAKQNIPNAYRVIGNASK